MHVTELLKSLVASLKVGNGSGAMIDESGAAFFKTNDEIVIAITANQDSRMLTMMAFIQSAPQQGDYSSLHQILTANIALMATYNHSIGIDPKSNMVAVLRVTAIDMLDGEAFQKLVLETVALSKAVRTSLAEYSKRDSSFSDTAQSAMEAGNWLKI